MQNSKITILKLKEKIAQKPLSKYYDSNARTCGNISSVVFVFNAC